MRIDKAIMPEWKDGCTSPIDTVFKVQILKGTKLHIGNISYQEGFYMGGTHQIVIPNAKNTWYKSVGIIFYN